MVDEPAAVAPDGAILRPLILAVDDEPGILRLLRLELTASRFDVLTANSGEEALRIAEERRPDAVLLDVVMPGMSGLEALSALKARSPAPVILLSAKDGEADKTRGLALGADDYITKPFSPDEVSTRLRRVLRQNLGIDHEEHLIHAGRIEINLERRTVTRNGAPIALSSTEWRLLAQIATKAGRVVTSEQLLAAVWGSEYRNDLEYLRVWVTRLQRKLEDDPSHPALIKQSNGSGYLLAV